ncbi:MAG TPA: sigma-70 family RNA polymerase sigma factor [Streptosporangiaceae bacterium]|nr:sigma-70 family RNA polymerase sigma factor [Streptosporangiaceae bacterium]
MTPTAPRAVTATGTETCGADGCAGLCTERGMAAAHAAYHARMLARARQIVVDPDLAEDVVQEAFLRAWRACSSFDPAGGPRVNWLLVITANTAFDAVKARVRRPPLASGRLGMDAPEAGLGDIDRLILRTQLRQALSRLRAHHRDAVVETVLRDRPYADVAAELGIAPATLRTRVHYGLRRLRRVLEAADAAALTPPCTCS